eukprot:GHVH01014072.1.p1 GENE.GHVH01014072.1~~GHVH01014072.1.p1  ORF type:complete len:2409 (+),score=321.17 GHVH01014072.1:129-7355(+)
MTNPIMASPTCVNYSTPELFFASVPRPIKRILIANNGNAAIKGMRSMNAWSHMLFEEGIFEFVVMATEDDLKAKADYIFQGDTVVSVPPGPTVNNYSNITLIVDIAIRERCDAVWPGWGHASENYKLAEAITNANLIWIGPNAAAMISLGDKIGSSIIAQSVDVPCVGWSGSDIVVDIDASATSVAITEDLLMKACVTDAKNAKWHAERIGYPLMMKASQGGGGKGIRRVYKIDEVDQAFHAVTNEVPDSPVFLMGLVESCRHLEVQVIADSYGNAWAVNSRDCTLQRRCQKMIEEGPITAAPRSMVDDMERSAERLATCVGYENAATVEYLFDPQQDKYYFLEVNARLQVEHVVSEENSDVNLPAAQLLVAMGVALTDIQDLNKWYNREDKTKQALRHCVACRVTAEHAEENFRPTAGKVTELCFSPGPHVWGYFSIGATGCIHQYADSQFGHIFAMGETRMVAIKRMIVALNHLVVRGEIHTNIDALIQLLKSDDFRNNQTTTTWMESRFCLKSLPPPNTEHSTDMSTTQFFMGLLAATVFRTSKKFEKSIADFRHAVDTGHTPHELLLSTPQDLVFRSDSGDVKFRCTAMNVGPNRIRVALGSSSIECEYNVLDDDGGMMLNVNGVSRRVYCLESQGIRVKFSDNSTMLFHDDVDPSLVISDMSGRILRWLIADGEMGYSGDAFCEIEVMKMFMPLKLNRTGRMKHSISEGTTFKSGDVLAVLSFDDVPDAVTTTPATVHKGSFCDDLIHVTGSSLSNMEGQSLQSLFEYLQKTMKDILNGYEHPHGENDASEITIFTEEYMKVMCHEDLMRDIGLNILSKVSRLLPDEFVQSVKSLLLHEGVEEDDVAVCMNELTSKYWSNGQEISELYTVLGHLVDPREWRCELVINHLELFLEQQSAYRDWERAMPTDDSELMVQVFRAHAATYRSVEILSTMIGSLCRYYGADDFDTLHNKMSSIVNNVEEELNTKDCQKLVLACRCLRLSRNIPRLPERIRSVIDAFNAVLSDENMPQKLADFYIPPANSDWLVNTTKVPDDALIAILTGSECDLWMRKFAFWLYVRRHYESLGLNRMDEIPYDHDSSRMVVLWTHSSPLDGRYLQTDEASSNFTATPKDKEKGRLRHMLRIFHGDLNDSAANIELTSSFHQSIGCAFSCANDFMQNAMTVLEDIHQRYNKTDSSIHPQSNVSLVCFIGLKGECLVQPASRGAESDENDQFPKDFPITADWLFESVKSCKPVLQALRVQTIKIVYLSGRSREPRMHGFFYWQPFSFNSRLRLLYFSAHNLANLNGSARQSELSSGKSRSPTRDSLRYQEVELLRFCPLPFVQLLELSRMCHFNITPIPILQPSTFIFKAIPKLGHSKDSRFFCRTIVQFHHPENSSESHSYQSTAGSRFSFRVNASSIDGGWVDELEREFLSSLQSLETVMQSGSRHTARRSQGGNHLLMVLLTYGGKPDTCISAKDLSHVATEFFRGNQTKIEELNLRQVEVRVLQRGGRQVTLSVPMRVILDDPTGQAIRCRVYAERVDPSSGTALFHPIRRRNINGIEEASGEDLSAHNPVNTPHPVLTVLDEKRVLAMKFGTIYARDFLHLFEASCLRLWEEALPSTALEGRPRTLSSLNSLGAMTPHHSDISPRMSQGTRQQIPDKLLEAVELVLDENDVLCDVKCAMKPQTIGMLAWEVTLKTPEFPQARTFILISNDITNQRGSFGVKEDLLFLRATERAIASGCPRVFIAANSGARIGIAQEIRDDFQIEWIDESNPSKGFHYLYLTAEEYAEHRASVRCTPIDHPIKGLIYVLEGIIGKEVGMGVENLAGSGAIAGITSKAYDKVATYTYVTGLTVGIGAYLTRLGHRVIQKATHAPILLTGYQALNKLNGKEVYRSNNEIGGPGVMHRNGVACDLVENDLEGCYQLLKLLSYAPCYRHGPMAISTMSVDAVDRPIQYKGDNSADPRYMLSGKYVASPENPDRPPKWLGGIFDKNSWLETNINWAKSVITGRARLGGIPIGAIAVETRSTDAVVLADPAMPESTEICLKRAGQVWYPDSAYKTAQAINDFNREELPLIIFANWRGFSGGQRDMFFEVLKFGSMIVDALVAYNQPVFVYLAPYCELRGGAWVVVDPRINELNMEMYADPRSRGGVMEPSGTVAIKYRDNAIRQTIMRLDPEYKELLAEDGRLANQGVQVDDMRRKTLADSISKRFKDLLPSYQKAATSFCDLHDCVYRMEAHGAINGQVKWEDARAFFYWRLRRQLVVNELRNEVEVMLEMRQDDVSMNRSELACLINSKKGAKTVDCYSQENLPQLANAIIEDWLTKNGFDSEKNIVNVACHAATLDWGLYLDRLFHFSHSTGLSTCDSKQQPTTLERPSPSLASIPAVTTSATATEFTEIPTRENLQPTKNSGSEQPRVN